MKNLKLSFSIVVLSLFLDLSELNAFENASIEMRISDYREAVSNNDWDGIVSVIPPRLLRTMAGKFDLEVNYLITGMKQVMKNAMESVSIVYFELDLRNAVKNESSSGRIYLLIPTTAVMQSKESLILGESHTLAFVDDKIWYLVRLDEDTQILFLKEAYPEFESVTLPKGTMNIIEIAFNFKQ